MIGKKLQQIRKILHIKGEDIASELGISQRTYFSYERAERKASFELLVHLSKKYNVNLNWLISDIGQMFNAPKFEDVEDAMEAKVMAILKKQGVIE